MMSFVTVILQTWWTVRKQHCCNLMEFYQGEPVLPSSPLLLPPPLCIIHHRGLLPCFPRLFLPSMPVTLTASPNPLLLPTASLPPSGSWITSHFFHSFSCSWYLWVPSTLFLHPSIFIPAPVSSPLYQTFHSLFLSSFFLFLFIYLFFPFILVFPVPREYSLHISSEHSHRLLSWCNSLADIASCTYPSLSPSHTYIVYSKLLRCWHVVEKCFQIRRTGLWFVKLHTDLDGCPECRTEALKNYQKLWCRNNHFHQFWILIQSLYLWKSSQFVFMVISCSPITDHVLSIILFFTQ